MTIFTHGPILRPGYARSIQRPDPTLRIRIRPGVLNSLYAAHSRDVSKGAPQATRIEPRPVNETDFTTGGVADPDTEFPVQHWHRGVTN